jgi:large subunit ribosomal protein L13
LSRDSTNGKLLVIDASGLIVGRLASITAKHLILGDSVTIINVEKAVVTGSRLAILQAAHERLRIRNRGSKAKSPKHPRRPEGIVRRTIRGMLPMDKPKGKDAYSRLSVFVGAPETTNDEKATRPKEAENRSPVSLTTVGQIAQNIGWKPLEA